MMSTETLLSLSLIIPALGAIGVAASGRRPNLRESVTVLSGITLFACIALITSRYAAGERVDLLLGSLLPGLELRLTPEPLGLLFALLASGLWIPTSVYAVGYMRGNNEANQTRFYICFAVAIFAAMGIALAGNLITLFIFYEVLTLSTFPLVTHKGNADAKRGGRIYLGILLTTSIGLLLPAIVYTWHIAGTVDFVAGGILAGKTSPAMLALLYALFIFGIGKAATMPFHRWLPAAMVAPTPVSALLHAVAVVKAGVFTVLKITTYTFGLDLLTHTGASEVMMFIAAFTLLAASCVAMTKDNLKARLAYSTVSQLAYIVLGATLATAATIVGGGLHILMHAMAKITLFFCAGAIYTALHKTEISDLDGMGKVMPFTFAAFFIAALSIIGLPPLGGSWSKWWLMTGTVDADQYWILAVFGLSSLLSIAYLLPIPIRAFMRPARDNSYTGINEAPLASVAPLCLTAIGCIVLFFCAEPIVDWLMPITQDTTALAGATP